MNLKPLSNRIIIEPDSMEKETKSGIVLPESATGEKPRMGTVVAIGPGKLERGQIIPMSVRVGDRVLFKKYGPDEIEINGKELLVGEEDDILAVIN
ncbi:MAG: co-chaperone GroES [Candidatus Harrisonbacteria bacterium CG10_big_fil_rev_8_21_14_0_10_45_28]|uniref:Co-chaperonin GroES n=1 Tax=Candidatus Harrisonbacteria bacterium CG10_big_fil_rev_8_21_14_0_10_45_28 TaxID=1974586 RepID=A0A2H0UNE8_9BACT|nr:MAG: co-chaperone GroES [Candidatus Harrisonbacteria bacterium CG10_big_fil_rev_8_21_14_0_10_45_28]